MTERNAIRLQNGRLRGVIIGSGVVVLALAGLAINAEIREQRVGPERDRAQEGVGTLVEASGSRDSAITALVASNTALANAVASNTVSIDSLWEGQRELKWEVYEIRESIKQRRR